MQHIAGIARCRNYVDKHALGAIGRFIATHPITRDDQIGGWFRFIRWQLQSRLQKDVVVPWIGGARLLARRGMTGATGNIYAGLHEFPDMMLLLHFLREGDLFIDVGANIGSFTILASKVRGANTLAFEPDPITAGWLRRNVELNTIADRVRVVEAAVGSEDSHLSFTVGRDTVNRVARPGDDKVRIVTQQTLDSVVGKSTPAMMKLDVEGFEFEALSGARTVLAMQSMQVVETEGVTPSIESIFADHGFSRGYYDPFSRSLSREPNGLRASNAVFIRDWNYVRKRLIEAPPIRVLNRSI